MSWISAPGVQILELLRAQAQAGRTVLVVTHNREISRVGDRVIELSSGHIVADGPPVRTVLGLITVESVLVGGLAR